MRKRWVLWLFPLTGLIALAGVAISMLAFLPGTAYAGFMATDLPAVSKHWIPEDVAISDPSHGARPHSYWLVRTGDDWRAFANRDPNGWGSVYYEERGNFFWARRGWWDTRGAMLRDFPFRNLDQFAVTVDPAGRVGVDLSTVQVGSESPVDALESFLDALARKDARAAWSLVHPDRRTPAAFEAFNTALAQSGPVREYSISRQTWVTQWQDLSGRTWDRVMAITLFWKPTSSEQIVHLAPDADGHWCILWSPTFAIE